MTQLATILFPSHDLPIQSKWYNSKSNRMSWPCCSIFYVHCTSISSVFTWLLEFWSKVTGTGAGLEVTKLYIGQSSKVKLRWIGKWYPNMFAKIYICNFHLGWVFIVYLYVFLCVCMYLYVYVFIYMYRYIFVIFTSDESSLAQTAA